MENIGLSLPTVVIPENNIISIIMQILTFVMIAGIVIYMVVLYFKNIELNKNPEKNQAEIEKNFENIKTIRKKFLKIFGIFFCVVILATIILSNFY